GAEIPFRGDAGPHRRPRALRDRRRHAAAERAVIRATRPAFRRALALAILAAGALFIYAVVIDPVVGSYSGDSSSIEQLQSALVRYQKAARELPELQTRLAALQRSSSGQSGYLEGENEALTAAALQERLKGLVQREGGQLKSMQSLPGK